MSTFILVALGVIVAALLWSWTVLWREQWPRRRRRCAACGRMMYLLAQDEAHPMMCRNCGGDFRMVGLVSDALWHLVRPHPLLRLVAVWTGVVLFGGVALERLVVEPLARRVVERSQGIPAGRSGGPLIEVKWVDRAWGWPWEAREERDATRYVQVVVRNSRQFPPQKGAVTVRLEPDSWKYERIDGVADQGTLSEAAFLKWMAQGWDGLEVYDRSGCAAEACALIRSGDKGVVDTMLIGPSYETVDTEMQPVWPWGVGHWWWAMGGVWMVGGAMLGRREWTSRKRIETSGPGVAV